MREYHRKKKLQYCLEKVAPRIWPKSFKICSLPRKIGKKLEIDWGSVKFRGSASWEERKKYIEEI